MTEITSKNMFMCTRDSITCSVYSRGDVGIYFQWCYWTDLETLKGALCRVRGVDIASSLWRVAEVRCNVDPKATYMRRTGRRVEGKEHM